MGLCVFIVSRGHSLTMGDRTEAGSSDGLSRGFEAAQDICRRHARSFYFASIFLPHHKRQAAFAVYAFCRLLDDATDRPGESAFGPADPQRAIARFERLLEVVYAGRFAPADLADNLPEYRSAAAAPALAAFAATVRRYRLEKQWFVDLMNGCRMDLCVDRYQTWNDLEVYCNRVAGAVGLMMCPIFGLSDRAALPAAIQMGNAMQLTNILRDIREDLERGRIYLPREDMDRFGVSEDDLAAGRLTDDFKSLMRFEISRARGMFRVGSAGLGFLAPDGSRQTACAMAMIYAGILDAIEALDFDVFSKRASISFWRKCARLPAALRLARREAMDPLIDMFTM